MSSAGAETAVPRPDGIERYGRKTENMCRTSPAKGFSGVPHSRDTPDLPFQLGRKVSGSKAILLSDNRRTLEAIPYRADDRKVSSASKRGRHGIPGWRPPRAGHPAPGNSREEGIPRHGHGRSPNTRVYWTTFRPRARSFRRIWAGTGRQAIEKSPAQRRGPQPSPPRRNRCPPSDRPEPPDGRDAAYDPRGAKCPPETGSRG